jgi:hypothetical protein
MVWEESAPSRCEGCSEEVGPELTHPMFYLFRKVVFQVVREGVKSGSEGINFGIEGSNIGIDVLDVSLVLGVVILQGKDVVINFLVAGVGHLGGKKARSGLVGLHRKGYG